MGTHLLSLAAAAAETVVFPTESPPRTLTRLRPSQTQWCTRSTTLRAHADAHARDRRRCARDGSGRAFVRAANSRLIDREPVRHALCVPDLTTCAVSPVRRAWCGRAAHSPALGTTWHLHRGRVRSSGCIISSDSVCETCPKPAPASRTKWYDSSISVGFHVPSSHAIEPAPRQGQTEGHGIRRRPMGSERGAQLSRTAARERSAASVGPPRMASFTRGVR
eukprot:2049589-Prymnesium_polylepis.1